MEAVIDNHVHWFRMLLHHCLFSVRVNGLIVSDWTFFLQRYRVANCISSEDFFPFFMISLKKNKIDISHEFPLLNTGTTALSALVLGIVLVLAFRVKVCDMYTIRGVHT